MTNSTILNVYNKLSKILGDDSIKFPSSVAYAIIRNSKNLQPIVQDVEQQRMAIINKYANINREENTYVIPAEHTEQAGKEFEQLFNIDTPVDIVKIHMSNLEQSDVTLEVMDALYFMIAEENGEG